MNVNGQWYVENRLIYLHLSGILLWEDAHIIDRLMLDFLDNSPENKVHLLTDIRSLIKPLPLGAALSLKYLKHPKLDLQVTFGQKLNEELKAVTDSVERVYNVKSRDFITLDVALQYLQFMDTSLPDLYNYKEIIPDYVNA